MQELRNALRTLSRSPVFGVTAIVLLAVAIGATTAVFSAVNTVLLRPLPFLDADRLVIAGERDLRSVYRAGTALATWREWSGHLRSFDGLAAVEAELPCRLGDGAYTSCARVSPNFFEVLGVRPIVGRAFAWSDASTLAQGVAMVTESFWKERLGGRNLAQADLTLAGRRYDVIGVVPATFKLSYANPGVWRLFEDSDAPGNRAERSVRLVGRLRASASVESARTEIEVAMRDLAARYPSTHAGWTGWVQTMREFTLGERGPLAALLGAVVGVVLLVACLNLAMLHLARAMVRQREFAVAQALGATPWRAVRPVMAEALLVSTAGGAGGVLLTWALRRLGEASVPELRDMAIDWHVLVFTATVSLLTALVSSAVPAMVACRFDVLAALKGVGSDDLPRAGRLRDACIALQTAGAVALVVAAIGLTTGLERLTNTDPGFAPDHVLAAELSVPPVLLRRAAAGQSTCDRLTGRLTANPMVEGVACASSLPFFEVGVARFSTDVVGGGARRSAASRVVSPGYLHVLRIPLVAGRDFARSDTAEAAPVAIVSERLARDAWPRGEAVGQRLRVDGEVVTIVGVASDVHSVGLRRAVLPEIYRPLRQRAAGTLSIAVRTTVQPLDFVSEVRDAVNDLAPEAAVSYVNTMDALVAEQSALVGWLTLVAAVFGTLAAALAAIGLHGTVSFLAARRTREIGIRMALGATRGDVVRLVAGAGTRAAAVGGVAGAALGFAGSRVLAFVLLDAASPAAAAVVSALAVMAVVQWSATWWPAWRAATLEPSRALREE